MIKSLKMTFKEFICRFKGPLFDFLWEQDKGVNNCKFFLGAVQLFVIWQYLWGLPKFKYDAPQFYTAIKLKVFLKDADNQQNTFLTTPTNNVNRPKVETCRSENLYYN